MSRPWLPRPPAVVRPAPCPTGQPRYASVALATAALHGHVAASPLTAVACQACGGAHHQTAAA